MGKEKVGRAGMENRVRMRPASPFPAGRTGGMGMVPAAGGQSFPPVATTQQPPQHSGIMLWKLLKKLNSLRKSSRGTVAG